MIEIIAAIARWFQLTANMTILGSCVFLAISGTANGKLIEPWVKRVERLFPWLGICIIIGLLAMLAVSAAQATGDVTKAWQPEVWLGILKDTRMGHIWIWRVSLGLILLGIVFYLRSIERKQWHYSLCGFFATLPLVAGSLVSHTAAEELSFLAVLPYSLHIVIGGIWLGALPAFLYLLYMYFKKENKENTYDRDVKTLTEFSRIAFLAMLVVIATGILVSYRNIEGHYAALVASLYGWFLLGKVALLVIILSIAAKIRVIWLPNFVKSKTNDAAVINANGMRRWIRVEYVIALALLMLATVVANTTPAKYAVIEEWPFPFRFSIIATWGSIEVMTQVWIGFAIFIMGILTIFVGSAKKWNLRKVIGIPLILTSSGLAVALPPLSIEAYPETYQRTPIPYDAMSIAHGASLYSESCVTCHGPQGKGNGILSRTFSTVMPDMLTEPHTEEHTAGDFYHWLTFGMKDTGMPGFADKYGEEDLWDIVNYIHALSRGYQSRILTPEIVPNKPYVIPPDFFYTAVDGGNGLLQDFRENKSILLVTFTWPQSKERLAQLSQIYDQLVAQNTEVLIVPVEELDAETTAQIAAKIPFPLVIDGASDIVTSYALYRRTLTRPDLLGVGTNPDHMEFLIDRYGYLRARWVPIGEPSGWDDVDLIVQQASLLNQEKQMLPLAKMTID